MGGARGEIQGFEPGGFLLPGRNYSSANYRFGFNGVLKDDEIYGSTGTSYDFGARMYDPRVGRWLSLDPLAGKYSHQSPYNFGLNNPILLVDLNGEEPIDPRTGKPIFVNMQRASVYEMDYIKSTQLSKVVDHDLLAKADNWFRRNMMGMRGKPDGMYDGAAYHVHESIWQHTSPSAVKALQGMFPTNSTPNSSWGAPNYGAWSNVAEKGTYTFIDDIYAESEVFFANKLSYNIMTVKQNYITQITHMSRANDGQQFNISSVTNFDIQKGDIQTRSVNTWWGGSREEKYRSLTVTETTQLYKNNEPSGEGTRQTYTREEIVK